MRISETVTYGEIAALALLEAAGAMQRTTEPGRAREAGDRILALAAQIARERAGQQQQREE